MSFEMGAHRITGPQPPQAPAAAPAAPAAPAAETAAAIRTDSMSVSSEDSASTSTTLSSTDSTTFSSADEIDALGGVSDAGTITAPTPDRSITGSRKLGQFNAARDLGSAFASSSSSAGASSSSSADPTASPPRSPRLSGSSSMHRLIPPEARASSSSSAGEAAASSSPSAASSSGPATEAMKPPSDIAKTPLSKEQEASVDAQLRIILDTTESRLCIGKAGLDLDDVQLLLHQGVTQEPGESTLVNIKGNKVLVRTTTDPGASEKQVGIHIMDKAPTHAGTFGVITFASSIGDTTEQVAEKKARPTEAAIQDVQNEIVVLNQVGDHANIQDKPCAILTNNDGDVVGYVGRRYAGTGEHALGKINYGTGGRQMIRDLTEGLCHISKNNLFQGDHKLANTLYTEVTGEIQIVVADLGGAVSRESIHESIASLKEHLEHPLYPLFEYNKADEMLNLANRAYTMFMKEHEAKAIKKDPKLSKQLSVLKQKIKKANKKMETATRLLIENKSKAESYMKDNGINNHPNEIRALEDEFRPELKAAELAIIASCSPETTSAADLKTLTLAIKSFKSNRISEDKLVNISDTLIVPRMVFSHAVASLAILTGISEEELTDSKGTAQLTKPSQFGVSEVKVEFDGGTRYNPKLFVPSEQGIAMQCKTVKEFKAVLAEIGLREPLTDTQYKTLFSALSSKYQKRPSLEKFSTAFNTV